MGQSVATDWPPDEAIVSLFREWIVAQTEAQALRARPEIIESTFDRVRYGFTTDFPYHILWW
jgi:hypothetical protein